jgi:hypothetical protein
MRMKLKLQACDLWHVIEYGDDDFRDLKETTTVAWEAVKTLHLDDERRRAVAAQTLRAEYEMTKLRDGESIEDFTLCFSGVVQCLAELGSPEPDAKAVKKYLSVVWPRCKKLEVSMEAFVDLWKLSIEEITRTLKSSDDAVIQLHNGEATPHPRGVAGEVQGARRWMQWLQLRRQEDSEKSMQKGDQRWQWLWREP